MAKLQQRISGTTNKHGVCVYCGQRYDTTAILSKHQHQRQGFRRRCNTYLVRLVIWQYMSAEAGFSFGILHTISHLSVYATEFDGGNRHCYRLWKTGESVKTASSNRYNIAATRDSTSNTERWIVS